MQQYGKNSGMGYSDYINFSVFAAGELIFTDSNNAKLLPGLGLLWSVFFGLSKIFGNKSNDKGE